MFIALRNATKKYGTGESLVYALDHAGRDVCSDIVYYFNCYATGCCSIGKHHILLPIGFLVSIPLVFAKT